MLDAQAFEVVHVHLARLTANVEVLAREDGWFKRKVREAIKINTRQPTINLDQGFDLPAIYNRAHLIVRPAISHSCHWGS